MNRQQRRESHRAVQPVTHRLDAAALHEAYKQEGLVRPELLTQKPQITGDKNNEGKNQLPTQESPMSNELNQNTETTTSSIPQVAKKSESKITLLSGPSLGRRAIERSVDAGIFAVGAVAAGAAIMALSHVILAGPAAAGAKVAK